MKAQEEILQSLNMLHKEVNKDSGTKCWITERGGELVIESNIIFFHQNTSVISM
jgi:hypothetical protein